MVLCGGLDCHLLWFAKAVSCLVGGLLLCLKSSVYLVVPSLFSTGCLQSFEQGHSAVYGLLVFSVVL